MKPARFMIASDSHGDMIDPVAEKAVLAFKKDYKPEIIIHLGDAFDFRNLRKGASDDEKAGSLEEDWEMGSDFLRRYFEGGKINHLLWGNHDWRAFELQSSATGVMRDYAKDGVKRLEQLAKRCRATTLPYDSRIGILRIGHLKGIHGYASGRNAGAVHGRVYRNCFYGHTHAIRVDPVEADVGPMEAVGVGALCRIDMPYNSRQTNKLMHNNGWVYGNIFPDGTYQYWQAKRIGNDFYAAQNIQRY